LLHLVGIYSLTNNARKHATQIGGFILWKAADFSHLEQETEFKKAEKQDGPVTEVSKHGFCYRAYW
jgi:hypothetical protein